MRTIGTDPEFMLIKDGKIHSAIGIVHGRTDNRIEISGHQFYYDNVLAECAVKPAESKEEFLSNLRECLQIYSEMVSPFELLTQASHHFSDDQLDHPDARKAGCAIEWCAYQIKAMKPPVEEIENGSFRTCGGHVHIGSEVCSEDGPLQICSIYMLDLLLGVPSIWLDDDPTSISRRSLYGAAGRYRVAGGDNPYGIEYRSLSNFWLKSPKLASLIYDLSMLAIDWCENGTVEQLWSFDFDLFLELQDNFYQAYTPSYDIKQLQLAINDSNKVLAKPFLDMVLSMMPQELCKQVQASLNTKEYGSFKQEWKLS